MSPLLKAIGVGVFTFAAMMFLLWTVSRLMNRPFFPRLERAPSTPATSDTTAPPLFPNR